MAKLWVDRPTARSIVLLTLTTIGLGLSITEGSALASTVGGSTVMVATNATFGQILTNAQGLALYSFSGDHSGIGTCTGSCATAWPPLTVPSGTAPTAGPGVTGTVAAVLQPDGKYQVTYAGSPLYMFVGDSSPGQVTGNGVAGFAVVKVSTPPPTSTPIPSTTSPTPSSAPAAAVPQGTTPSPAPVTANSATAPAASAGALAHTGPGPGLGLMLVFGVVLATGGAVLSAAARPRRRHRAP